MSTDPVAPRILDALVSDIRPEIESVDWEFQRFSSNPYRKSEDTTLYRAITACFLMFSKSCIFVTLVGAVV
jgi:hypothetical protein